MARTHKRTHDDLDILNFSASEKKKLRPKPPTFVKIPNLYASLRPIEDWYLEHYTKLVPFQRIGPLDAEKWKDIFAEDLQLGDFLFCDPLPTKNICGYAFAYGEYSEPIDQNLSSIQPIKLYGLHPASGAVLFKPTILEVMWLVHYHTETREALEKCNRMYFTTRAWPIGTKNYYGCYVNKCHQAETLVYFLF